MNLIIFFKKKFGRILYLLFPVFLNPLLLTGIFFESCNQKKQADYIINNAVIYTVDSLNSIKQSIAVTGNKIIATGSNEEILSLYESEKIIDCTNKYIYPGLVDAHCHFFGYAKNLRYADLINTSSFQEIIQIITEHNKKNPSQWIIGRGWDQNKWTDKKFPDNNIINQLFPDIPVILIRIDGHAALVNEAALHKAKITVQTVINGGKIFKAGNKLTGILLDKACDSIRNIIPALSGNEMQSLLNQAQKNCFSVGLTLMADAGLDKTEVAFYDSLQKAKVLKMRIYAMLNPTDENIKTWCEKGIYITDLLSVRSIKLYSDGALGSRGALLLKPYSDDLNNNGILVNSIEFLEKNISIAIKNKYQVNTHAIGDSAIRLILNLYVKHLKPDNDLRWRIEHAQVVNPDDLVKFRTFNIIPSVNMVHATSDMYWAEERLGKDRINNAYAYKKLLEQTGWLCNGSDFPVENINPLFGFYAAVSRKDNKGYPQNGFQKENAISREQALRAMTIWAAKACFMEKLTGSLESGKRADFIITDKNFMECKEQEIPFIKIFKTYINGICEFSLSAGNAQVDAGIQQ